LLSDKIDVVSHNKITSIAINNNSLILITIDQRPLGRGPNTSAQIYIKNNEDIILISIFRYTEPIEDLRKTKLYKLVEYIAKRICDKYHINWEYKFSIETAESRRRFSQGWVIMVLIGIFLIAMFLLANK
jgi:hypothetical protein